MRLEPLIAKKFEMKGSEKSRQSLLDDNMKKYQKPSFKVIKLDENFMVAASRCGMGCCKVTFE